MDTAAIRALAALFRTHGRNERLFPEGELEQQYAQLLRRMVRADVPGRLRGVAFRPCLLLNGLAFAATLSPGPARQVVRALARGLEAFAPLLARTRNDEALGLEPRYGAFVLGQFTDCGMGLSPAFATLKADSLDTAVAHAYRDILEGGPDALLASPLTPESERPAWRAYLEHGASAWPALRDLLGARAAVAFEPPYAGR
jgi:hypothetical protein